MSRTDCRTFERKKSKIMTQIEASTTADVVDLLVREMEPDQPAWE